MNKQEQEQFILAIKMTKSTEELTALLMTLPAAPPPSWDSPDPYERLEALENMPRASLPSTITEPRQILTPST